MARRSARKWPAVLRRTLGALSPRQRFSRDMWWTLSALAGFGISGMGINLLVANVHGAAALGGFNLVLHLYSVAAQLGALSQHSAATAFVSRNQDDPRACGAIVLSAMAVALVGGSLVAMALGACRQGLADRLSSPDLALGLLVAAPGVALFSINKVLFGALSGVRHMRAHATLLTGRYLTVFVFTAVGVAIGLPVSALPIAFTATELCVLGGAVGYLHSRVFPLAPDSSALRQWLPRQLSFGSRALVGDLLGDAYARLDVLLLGLFSTNAVVGVYSFASTIAYGLSTIPDLVQRNLHSIVGRHLTQNRRAELHELTTRVRRTLLPLMITLGTISIASYPALLLVVSDRATFLPSWSIFTTLMIAIVASSGGRPFLNLLPLAGRPGTLSALFAVGIALKLLLGLWLIPIWSGIGAAVAAAAALAALVALNTATVRCVLSLDPR